MNDAELAKTIANDPFHKGLEEHGDLRESDESNGMLLKAAGIFVLYFGLLALMARVYA